MDLTLAEIADAADATLPDGCGALRITGVSTDTRSLAQGDLFVALRGERFDGHDHIGDAFAKGAAAALADRQHAVSGVASGPVLAADDTLIAYGLIARHWRRKFNIPVVAITGSVGKTTTKELTALALSPLGPVLRTELNENNEVGLPKTLLRLSGEHAAVVLEMGMRGLGQIEYLAQIAEPTIGIVTIVGESHIELLGSRESIADAKGELLAALPKDGTALVNIASDFADRLTARSNARVMTFGDSAEADFAMINAQRIDDGWTSEVKTPGGEKVNLRLVGPARHDLVNASAALAAASIAGVSPADAARALQAYVPGAMRMEVHRHASGAVIISDCYNAAPTSIRAALETLAGSHGSGRKIAFLGDMKELGAHAEAMHAQVARYAVALGIEEVYTVGPEFGRMPGAARRFTSSAEAADFARASLLLAAGDTVLVKGSRAMTMEAVVEALLNP